MQTQFFEGGDKTFLHISLFLNFLFIYHCRDRSVDFACISLDFPEEGAVEVIEMNLKVLVALPIQFSLNFVLLGLPDSISDVFAFEDVAVVLVKLEEDRLLYFLDFENVLLQNGLGERVR